MPGSVYEHLQTLTLGEAEWGKQPGQTQSAETKKNARYRQCLDTMSVLQALLQRLLRPKRILCVPSSRDRPQIRIEAAGGARELQQGAEGAHRCGLGTQTARCSSPPSIEHPLSLHRAVRRHLRQTLGARCQRSSPVCGRGRRRRGTTQHRTPTTSASAAACAAATATATETPSR